MNEKIKEKYSHPCLVFFYKTNPDFGKTFTIADVPYINSDLHELYGYSVDNFATLGIREVPDYDDWFELFIQNELKQLKASSEREYTVNKIAVCSLEEIEVFFNQNPTIRFIDEDLNIHFGLVKKCPKCNIAMVEGIAIDPVGLEGNLRHFSPPPPPLLDSETLKVIKCLKCPVCGFSESTINNDQDERKDMH